MKPAIKAMQEWLKTCPLVAGRLEDDGIAFRVSYLEAGAEAFSIEDTPSDPVLRRYFSGTLRRKSYAIASRSAYTPDIAQQAANSGFFDSLVDWIEAENCRRSFPDLGEGRQVRGVGVASTAYIISSEDGSCRLQLEVYLDYYQQRGVL